MSKARASVAQFNIEPYDGTLYFTTSRKAYKYIRSCFIEGDIDLTDCAGMSSEFGATQLVGVFDFSAATLSHELAHMTFKILERAGVPTNAKTSEAFCYMMSCFTAKCFPLMVKAEKDAKKRKKK